MDVPGNPSAKSALLTWGVNLSFFLALGVMFGLGGTGGFLGPAGVDPCFIPLVALTNCVNHACIGPASKSSSSPGVVAPAARTPPRALQRVDALFWSSGVTDGSRL